MSCNSCKRIKILIENSVGVKKLLKEANVDESMYKKCIDGIVEAYGPEIKENLKNNMKDLHPIVYNNIDGQSAQNVQLPESIGKRNKDLYDKISGDKGLAKKIIDSLDIEQKPYMVKGKENVEAINYAADAFLNFFAAYEASITIVTHYIGFVYALESVSSIQNFVRDKILEQVSNALSIQDGMPLPPEGQSKGTALPTVDKCPAGSTLKYGPSPMCYDRGGTPVAIYEEPKPSGPPSRSRPDVMITKESKKSKEIKFVITENKKSYLLKEVSGKLAALLQGLSDGLSGLKKQADDVFDSVKNSGPEAIAKALEKFSLDINSVLLDQVELIIKEIENAPMSQETKKETLTKLQEALTQYKAHLDNMATAKHGGGSGVPTAVKADSNINKAINSVEQALKTGDAVAADLATTGAGRVSQKYLKARDNLSQILDPNNIKNPWLRWPVVLTLRNRYYTTAWVCSAIGFTTTIVFIADTIAKKALGLIGVNLSIIAAFGTWAAHFYSMVRAGQLASGKLDYKGAASKITSDALEIKLKDIPSKFAHVPACYWGAKTGAMTGLLFAGLSEISESSNEFLTSQGDKYKLSPEQIRELQFKTQPSENPFINFVASAPNIAVIQQIIEIIYKDPGNTWYTDYDKFVDQWINIPAVAYDVTVTAVKQFKSVIGVKEPTHEMEKKHNELTSLLNKIPQAGKSAIKLFYSISYYQFDVNRDQINKFEVVVKGKKITGVGAYLLCLLSTKIPTRVLMRQVLEFLKRNKTIVDNTKPDDVYPDEYVNNIVNLFTDKSYSGSELETFIRNFKDSSEFKSILSHLRTVTNEVSTALEAVKEDKDAFIDELKFACETKQKELDKLFNVEYKAKEGESVYDYVKRRKQEREEEADLKSNKFYDAFLDAKKNNTKVSVFKLGDPDPEDKKRKPNKGLAYEIYNLVGKSYFTIAKDGAETKDQAGKPILYKVDDYVLAKQDELLERKMVTKIKILNKGKR